MKRERKETSNKKIGRRGKNERKKKKKNLK